MDNTTTTTTTAKPQLTVLTTGKEWLKWRFQLMVFMQMKGYDEDTFIFDDKKEEAECVRQIMGTVSEPIKMEIAQTATTIAKDIVRTLKTKYGAVPMSEVNEQERMYREIKIGDKETVQHYRQRGEGHESTLAEHDRGLNEYQTLLRMGRGMVTDTPYQRLAEQVFQHTMDTLDMTHEMARDDCDDATAVLVADCVAAVAELAEPNDDNGGEAGREAEQARLETRLAERSAHLKRTMEARCKAMTVRSMSTMMGRFAVEIPKWRAQNQRRQQELQVHALQVAQAQGGRGGRGRGGRGGGRGGGQGGHGGGLSGCFECGAPGHRYRECTTAAADIRCTVPGCLTPVGHIARNHDYVMRTMGATSHGITFGEAEPDTFDIFVLTTDDPRVSNGMTAMTTTTGTTPTNATPKDYWLDSCSMLHLTGDNSQLRNYEEFDEAQRPVFNGAVKGARSELHGKGDLEFNGPTGNTVRITDVFYSPHASAKVLSEPVLRTRGMKFDTMTKEGVNIARHNDK